MSQPFDELQLSPLARAFRRAFQSRFPHLPYQEGVSAYYEIRIPAPHAAIGELLLLVDADEVTAVIGEHFHCHFEAYLHESEADGIEWAMESALDFAHEFMTEQLFLRVYSRGDQVVGASVLSPNSPHASSSMLVLPSGASEQQESEADYVWSGPMRSSRTEH